MKTKTIKTVILHFGFVESAKIAPLIYSTDKKYKNHKLALFDLAEDLLMKYYQNLSGGMDDKCYRSPVGNEHDGENFCKYCGNNLNKNLIDQDEFECWLCNLVNEDCDSYGPSDECIGLNGAHEFRWSYASSDLYKNITDGNFVIIWDQAEKYLSTLLADKYLDFVKRKYIHSIDCILKNIGNPHPYEEK